MSTTAQSVHTITLLLGGVRAGKSGKALALASAYASAHACEVLFVATAQAFDDEMSQRIAAHKSERPAHWHTLEEPVDIATNIISALHGRPNIGVIVIDCLTLWVSNLLLSASDSDNVEAQVGARTVELLTAISQLPTPIHVVIVSNEVGLGIVPPTALGRKYRDALGRANQLVAAAADHVTLMVAGLELPIKRPS